MPISFDSTDKENMVPPSAAHSNLPTYNRPLSSSLLSLKPVHIPSASSHNSGTSSTTVEPNKLHSLSKSAPNTMSPITRRSPLAPRTAASAGQQHLAGSGPSPLQSSLANRRVQSIVPKSLGSTRLAGAQRARPAPSLIDSDDEDEEDSSRNKLNAPAATGLSKSPARSVSSTMTLRSPSYAQLSTARRPLSPLPPLQLATLTVAPIAVDASGLATTAITTAVTATLTAAVTPPTTPAVPSATHAPASAISPPTLASTTATTSAVSPPTPSSATVTTAATTHTPTALSARLAAHRQHNLQPLAQPAPVASAPPAAQRVLLSSPAVHSARDRMPQQQSSVPSMIPPSAAVAPAHPSGVTVSPPVSPSLPSIRKPSSPHRNHSSHAPLPLLTSSSSSALAPPSTRPAAAVSHQTFHVHGQRYIELASIGRGATSKVYKVINEHRTCYALKVITLPAGSDGERGLVDIENEVRIMQRLKGRERCIQLIDYERRGSCCYMVLELGSIDLNGYMQSLSRGGTDGYRLHPIKLRELWLAMLECVSVCHTVGVLHRDLKPANFVFVDGVMKIIDFGIAKLMGESDAANPTAVLSDSAMGTINYMSPESLSDNGPAVAGSTGAGVRQNRKSDVWSLGCILYQLVYGKCPFADYVALHTKLRAITDERVALMYPERGKDGAVVGKWVLDVMQRCLVREVGDRASIDELLAHRFLNPDDE